MKRDYIEIFSAKLRKHGIKGKDLAEASGRNPKTISEILNRKASPSIESFNHLIECCDRLSPGFADEYYLALAGHVDLDNFVSSLSSNELAVLLMNVSQRIRKLGARENAIANTLQVLPPESVKELIEPLTEVLRAIGIAVGKVQ